jgi:Fe-S cluster biogenesis protein NfuA
MIRAKLSSSLRRLLGRESASEHPTVAPPTPGPVDAPTAPPDTDAVERVPAALDRAHVEQVIEAQIRPALRADGGDIELVDIQGADVHVRLQGACRGCPGASMTLRMGVEALLRDEIPGFGRVVDRG